MMWGSARRTMAAGWSRTLLFYGAAALVSLTVPRQTPAQQAPPANVDVQPSLLQSAAGGVARLASLVPDDVGLLFEAENIGQHSRRFLQGAFYRRFEQFPPVAAWHQQNATRLDQIADQIARQLGISREEFWTKLLGHQAALAVWPPSTGAATDGRMLLLVEAGDDGVLERVVQSFCQAQQRVGDITEAREITHAGKIYQVRVLRRDGVDFRMYLAAVGKIGVLTGDEDVMRQVLDLYANPHGAGSVAQLATYQASQLRLRPEATVRMFVNPRPWEPAIRAIFEAAGDDLGLVETAFLETWKIADYWVSSAEIRADSFVIESFFSFDRRRLPAPLRQVEDGLTGKAQFLQHVPTDAAAAFAGRIDLGRLGRVFLANGAAGEENYEQVRDLARGLLLGINLDDDVLLNLGPEVGTFLRKSDEAFPIEVVIGVEAQPRPAGDQRPQVTKLLDTALRSAMQLLSGDKPSAATVDEQGGKAPGENRPKVHTEQVVGGTLTFLEGMAGLPPGFVLTYAVVGDYFFGGTAPRAVRGAIEINPADSLAYSPRVQALLSPRLTEPSQIVYIDCRVLRQLLKDHPQLFKNLVRLTRGLDDETIERGLTQLANLLELAETVVFAGKFDDEGLAFSFGLSLDEAAAPTAE